MGETPAASQEPRPAVRAGEGPVSPPGRAAGAAKGFVLHSFPSFAIGYVAELMVFVSHLV